MTRHEAQSSVDDPCAVSAPLETMGSERTDNKSAPERSCNSMCSGASPTSERTDRLMASVSTRPDVRPAPRPATCPVCGLLADNGILVRSELTATATFVDTAGHIFAVTWLEVAA